VSGVTAQRVKIRTVTVDLWGTIILDPPVADEVYEDRRLAGIAAILRDEGLRFTPAQLARAYAQSGHFLSKVWRTGWDVPVVEPVREILRSLDVALPERVRRPALTAIIEAYSKPLLLVPPRVDPEARVSLESLRKSGIVLALVSNTMRTPGTMLRLLLEQHGLLEGFGHLAFSDEVGMRKPRAEIFRAALTAVGGEPATTVHVGDDPTLDVRGARGAGLKAIQIIRKDAPVKPGDERPDQTITRFSELPAAIAALEAR
jgi:putative hydrolase of the HAD superfamily